MKAFFGALILSISSAAVGVFASTELHEMVMAASGADAPALVAPEDSANRESQQMKQQVGYSAEGAVEPVSGALGNK
jgi:hypothetical protein